MNVILDNTKMAMRAKLMPYAGMLDYRYKNLCVKTSKEALLPIEVKLGDNEMPLENCAKSGIIDEEHFMIAPLKQELVIPVCQAFLETHPQLKQDLYNQLDNPYISAATKNKLRNDMELFKEQTGEVLVLPQVLILTTPEVNDDEKKMLNDTVDVLKKQCEVIFSKEYAKFKSDMNAQMARSKPEELLAANKELDNEYQALWKTVEDYTMQERMTIEQANERYHQRKASQEGESEDNENTKVYQSMKFGEYEE